MTGAISPSGSVEISFDGQPELELLSPSADFGEIALPGSLWRVGLRQRQDGGFDLLVSAHRAAADFVSIQRVLEQVAQDPPGDVGKGSSFREHAHQANPAPGSSDHRRDISYWKEILHRAPPIAPFTRRSRAAAPAGLGTNRGPIGVLLGAVGLLSLGFGAEELSARVLAAYTAALADRFALDDVLLDCWFTERGDQAPDDLIGPLDSFHPIVLHRVGQSSEDLMRQVERAIAGGRSHRGVDTPSIEQAFEQDLRRRHIGLRQFGFACLGASRDIAARLGSISAILHEVQLAVALDEDALSVRLCVDLDVVDEVEARVLFDAFLVELAGMVESAEPLRLGDAHWIRLDAQGIQQPITKEDISALDGLRNIDREIAVTSTQMALLRFQEHPRATRHARIAFVVSKELKVRPQMDVERLKRSIATVIGRHDVMRTRFFQKGDGYGAYLEKTPTEFLTVEHVADEAEALQRAGILAQEGIDIRAPMFRVTLIRYGTEGDIVVAKGHHLVLDGYSLGLIVEETVKAYLGLPLDPVEMTIDQFIRDLDHVGKPGSFEARDAFLRRIFAEPLPEVPNIGRKAKGHRPNVDIVDCALGLEVTLSIPADQYEALRRRAQAAGATETGMVIAAFAQTIGARGGVDDLILQIPTALRHDRRLENYVNFVASDLPVRVRLSRHDTLEALAVALRDGIDEAIQFAPFMDANYFGEIHDEVVAKGSYTSLFVVGSRTVDKWTRGTTSAPLQRSNVAGELDLGMFKVTPLPDMRQQRPCISDLDLRCYPTSQGLGLALAIDTLGYDAAEGEEILREVAERLLTRQAGLRPTEQAGV